MFNNRILCALFGLSLAFTLSCSEDKDDKGPVCSNVQTITIGSEKIKYGKCYDGSNLILELECAAIPAIPIPLSNEKLEFKYESNSKCPDGEKKQCKSNAPFPLAIVHEYGDLLILSSCND